MRCPCYSTLALLVLGSLSVLPATAQDAPTTPTVVVVLNYMKAAPGMTAAYVQAERETFMPIHQELANAAKMISWGLYNVLVPGNGTDFDYVTVDVNPGYTAMETARQEAPCLD